MSIPAAVFPAAVLNFGEDKTGSIVATQVKSFDLTYDKFKRSGRAKRRLTRKLGALVRKTVQNTKAVIREMLMD